jgi:RimJ/RimL family protein N-acetyltransferase
MREMTRDDAQYVVAWRNQPEIRRFLFDSEPLTVERHLAFFEKTQARGDVMLMLDTPEGEPIGTHGFYNFDAPRTMAEYGRFCRGIDRRSPWDMKEAIYLGHRLMFELLGLQRAYFSTLAENTAVRRLMSFIPFLQEGYRPRHLLTPLGYMDLVEAGMFAEGFEAKKPDMEPPLYGDEAPPRFEPAALQLAERMKQFVASPHDPR